MQTRPWPGHQRCNWRLSPRAHVIYVLVWETQRAARDPKIGQRVVIYIGCHISRFYNNIRVKKKVMIFLTLIIKDTFCQFHRMILITGERIQGRRTRRSLCHGHSLITQREKLITQREKQSYFKQKVGKYEGMQDPRSKKISEGLMTSWCALMMQNSARKKIKEKLLLQHRKFFSLLLSICTRKQMDTCSDRVHFIPGFHRLIILY